MDFLYFSTFPVRRQMIVEVKDPKPGKKHGTPKEEN